jgi:uncharacterized protein
MGNQPWRHSYLLTHARLLLHVILPVATAQRPLIMKSIVVYAVLYTLLCLGSAGIGAVQPPTSPQFGFVGPDPTPPGTVSWSLLGKARTVQKPNKKTGPQFTPEIKELNGKDVKLYGFMLPLDGGTSKQKRFLLVAWPPHCSFCLPGGPELMAEVIADKPIAFTQEPIVVAGKIQVLEDDVVYYRLTKATQVKL